MNDTDYLNKALDLAKIRRGFCSPNPSVGAIIVHENTIIATGFHAAAGLPHAEVDALTKLNNKAEGATAYVTLEPCCHHGKTPPCTQALINAGIKRVVYGYRDPNPLVAGKGEKSLLSDGIACEYQFHPAIHQFYTSYNHWHQTNRPFVTAKIAMTLDNKIAHSNNKPIEITGKQLNERTHLHRKNADAILTTSKTIIHDNPKLNARLNNEIIAKHLYILDSQLKILSTAEIFTTARSITIFHSESATDAKKISSQEKSIRYIPVNTHANKLDLTEVLDKIGNDGIHDLWVEAGSECFTAFATQNLLNRALIYIAPFTVGEGISAFSSHPISFPTENIHWEQVGRDVCCEILYP